MILKYDDYDNIMSYSVYMRKNKIIGFLYCGMLAICLGIIFFVYIPFYSSWLLKVQSYIQNIINNVYVIFPKNSFLSLDITLLIFTFTTCSFLLKDDTTLGLSIYEITNWKFSWYKYARRISMISPIVVCFLQYIDLKNILCIFFVALILGTIFQLYVCLSIFDYKGNSYVIAGHLLEQVKTYDEKNLEDFKRYFSDLCTYVSKSKSRFGLEMIVDVLIKNISNDACKNDKKLESAYRAIMYIVGMYMQCMFKPTNANKNYTRSISIEERTKNLIDLVINSVFEYEKQFDNFDKEAAIIYSKILSSAIVIESIYTFNSAELSQLFAMLEYREDNNGVKKEPIYYFCLATLKVYTELNFESLYYKKTDLSYVRYLASNKTIDAQIKNRDNIKFFYLQFYAWMSKTNRKLTFAEYHDKFVDLYKDLLNINTINKKYSAFGLLLRLGDKR